MKKDNSKEKSLRPNLREKNKVTIKIPRPLYEKLQTAISGSGFRSVNEFIVHVLRDLVSLRSEKEGKEDLTEEEIRIIRERLKNLGYF